VREEWLGDFTKARDFSQTAPAVAEATATLSLDIDVLSRWVPTGQVRKKLTYNHMKCIRVPDSGCCTPSGQAGPSSKSFTEGSYKVMKGEYSLRLTDGAATATLTIV
jgi:hypothetical protein